ncbi:MMPL family transporter [Singulisphaera sp. Ch08]|uniref:MMPL family transporter n=1 Tax=Singulisphaera sp. Ch08 TaxID=3120278 RepID=A0AAU7CGE3_9BACT
MIRVLLKARYFAFTTVALILGLLIIFGHRVTYEQSIDSFFADDDPSMLAYQKAARTFGDDNFVFLVYDDPELLTPAGMARVSELAAAVDASKIQGVLRVESLDAMPQLWLIDDILLTLDRLPVFARNLAIDRAKKGLKNVDPKANALTVAGAVRSADRAGLEALRVRLTKHPLFRGTLIDGQGTTTAVVVRLRKTADHDVVQTVEALRSAADRFGSKHGLLKQPAVVGPPVLLADGFRSIEVDGRRLAVVGMLLIGFVTLSAVRSIWWALVPITSGWFVWLATEELLSYFQIKLALSGGPLVAQIIVLTMPAASHLAIHFREARRQESDPRVAARSALSAVWVPIFWCAVTGAIGYGALVTSDVVPIRQFGAILGTCTLLAALLVMLLSPIAMLPPIPLEIPVRYGSSSWVSAAMTRLTERVYRHPGAIVVIVFAIVLPLAAGMARLRYESNYINLFRPDTRVVRDYHAVEARLGGIGLVELIVPVGKTVGRDSLERLKALERAIAAIRVGGADDAANVISLATVLDPDGRLSALPREAADRTLATKLDLIASSPQAELLKGFWNQETGQARLMIRLKEQQPAPQKAALFKAALNRARAPFGPDVSLTGLSYLMTKTTESIIVTQWDTFFWSVAGILLMLTIALRGPVLAALAMMPTLLAVAFVLGLMGWLGIKLDMATALVASVALGLSVDDTFHCLLQFRKERASNPFESSLFDSYAVTGPGVLLSSLAVAVGFAALWLSEFAPFATFGTMVGIATAGSTLGNLVLLPACLTLGERLRVRLRSKKESVRSSV